MGCRPTRGILERSESNSRRDIQSAIPDDAISVGFGLFWQGSGHFFGIIPCGDSEKALRPKGIKLSCTKFGPSLKTLILRSMERTGPRSTSVRSICA